MFWVYTLLCRDNSLYTGFTDDIKRRVYAHYHRLKSAAKYTKSHKVCGIAGLWLLGATIFGNGKLFGK